MTFGVRISEGSNHVPKSGSNFSSDLADEMTTIGDNCQGMFSYICSVSTNIYMQRLNKTKKNAFDHTDNGDQPGHPRSTSTFDMSTWTTLIRLGGCSA